MQVTYSKTACRDGRCLITSDIMMFDIKRAIRLQSKGDDDCDPADNA